MPTHDEATKQLGAVPSEDCLVVLLRRGWLVMAPLGPFSSPSEHIALTYYDELGDERASTHFHPRDTTDWQTFEGRTEQLKKLGVPEPVHLQVHAALKLAVALRNRDVGSSIESIVATNRYARIAKAGEAITVKPASESALAANLFEDHQRKIERLQKNYERATWIINLGYVRDAIVNHFGESAPLSDDIRAVKITQDATESQARDALKIVLSILDRARERAARPPRRNEPQNTQPTTIVNITNSPFVSLATAGGVAHGVVELEGGRSTTEPTQTPPAAQPAARQVPEPSPTRVTTTVPIKALIVLLALLVPLALVIHRSGSRQFVEWSDRPTTDAGVNGSVSNPPDRPHVGVTPAPLQTQCATDYFLVGVEFSTREPEGIFSSIKPICRRVKWTRTRPGKFSIEWASDESRPVAAIGLVKSNAQSFRCPQNSLLVGMDAYFADFWAVPDAAPPDWATSITTVEAHCAVYSKVVERELSTVASENTPLGRRTDLANRDPGRGPSQCPANQLPIGLLLRAGDWIQAIGLECALPKDPPL